MSMDADKIQKIALICVVALNTIVLIIVLAIVCVVCNNYIKNKKQTIEYKPLFTGYDFVSNDTNQKDIIEQKQNDTIQEDNSGEKPDNYNIDDYDVQKDAPINTDINSE